jgi:acyl-CoA synthetase (AMP-forming)/AMP-acid ligase II
MRITDRAKDLIKSGGEWISSSEVEAAALAHPGIAFAAVIGVPHDRWGERPKLYVQPLANAEIDTIALLETVAAGVAKWWLPDEVEVLDALPLGSTGKVDKMALRRRLDGETA